MLKLWLPMIVDGVIWGSDGLLDGSWMVHDGYWWVDEGFRLIEVMGNWWLMWLMIMPSCRYQWQKRWINGQEWFSVKLVCESSQGGLEIEETCLEPATCNCWFVYATITTGHTLITLNYCSWLSLIIESSPKKHIWSHQLWQIINFFLYS